MSSTTPRAVRALVTYAALRTGAGIGDFFVQTSHQAEHKADKDFHGRRVLITHALTYGATQAAVLYAANRILGTGISRRRMAEAILFSTVTHGYIDQRTPVEDIADALKKLDFYNMAPPLGGGFHMDQALHHLMEGIAALLGSRD